VVVDEIEPDIEDPDAWCVGYRTDAPGASGTAPTTGTTGS